MKHTIDTVKNGDRDFTATCRVCDWTCSGFVSTVKMGAADHRFTTSKR